MGTGAGLLWWATIAATAAVAYRIGVGAGRRRAVAAIRRQNASMHDRLEQRLTGRRVLRGGVPR